VTAFKGTHHVILFSLFFLIEEGGHSLYLTGLLLLP
jgi:hypothetical protein